MDIFNRRFLRNENKEAWAGRFYEAARRTNRLYRNDGPGLMYVSPSAEPRRLLTTDDFYAVAHSLVEIIEEREEKSGEMSLRSVFLTPAEAKILFSCHEEADLPVLRCTTKAPLALRMSDGAFIATSLGFNPQEGHNVYYYVEPGKYPISPIEGVKHLTECFSGVPFEKPGYRNNLLAWLLGAVVLDSRMDTPFLVVSGNQQGIGKSACIQAAGHILSGSEPPPVDFHAGEFMKSVGTRFQEHDRIMFLDNIVTSAGKSFDNSQLSTMLTQGFSKKIRLLGHNRSTTATGILFAASLNQAKLSADLATRSLSVKLFKEENGPMLPYCRDYADNHRRELYGELLGLAISPPLPRKTLPYPDFRFRRWLEFVQPRIEAAFGPLLINEVSTLDDSTQELFHLGADILDQDLTADFFVQAVYSRRDRFPALFERFFAKIPSDRGRKSSAGTFLSHNHNRTFRIGEDTLRFMIRSEGGDHGGRQYCFIRDTSGED